MYRRSAPRVDEAPFVDENGHIAFGPGDVENPYNWSTARRAYITIMAIVLVTNATFALSLPSGCLQSISEWVLAPLANSPGVIADLWTLLERGNAMAAFACMVWVGPAVGPVASGFLELSLDWRWSFYVLLWLGGATLALLLTLPETFGPAILQQKAKRVALTRPWIILFDPISFLSSLYMAIVYLLLYILFSIYPIIFQKRRGWNAGVGELPLLGTVVGATIGAFVVLWDSRLKAKRFRAGEKLKPEDRLHVAMFGGVALAVCMFWMAWSGKHDDVHWTVPTMAGVFLAISMMLIFVSFLSYLVDTYLMYAASAIAANTACRSALSYAVPLFTNQMLTKLGVGGGGSLVGGVACLLAIIPFAFVKYGEQIQIAADLPQRRCGRPRCLIRRRLSLSRKAVAARSPEEQRREESSAGRTGETTDREGREKLLSQIRSRSEKRRRGWRREYTGRGPTGGSDWALEKFRRHGRHGHEADAEATGRRAGPCDVCIHVREVQKQPL